MAWDVLSRDVLSYILVTSVDSYKPVQPHFKLRNAK